MATWSSPKNKMRTSPRLLIFPLGNNNSSIELLESLSDAKMLIAMFATRSEDEHVLPRPQGAKLERITREDVSIAQMHMLPLCDMRSSKLHQQLHRLSTEPQGASIGNSSDPKWQRSLQGYWLG